jgi:hypothetical protein
MKEEKRPSIRRIALKSPAHARNLIRRVIAKIIDEGSEVANAGRIASLLTVWKGLYELEQLSDMEERLQAVEERQGIGQRIDLSKAKIKR